MNEIKVKTMADVSDETPNERNEHIERKKRIYRQALEVICPSKDIRALAKRISKRKCPCDKCAFGSGYLCNVPLSDGFIEDVGIDPCYFGVLMFLREEMGDSTDCGEMMKLRHELYEVNEALIATCEAVISSANSLPHFQKCKPDMQEFLIALAQDMRDTTQDILNEAICRKERIEVSDDNETEAKSL
ncbi:hypothetical protein FACS1894202_00990 [Clostridia bacterium]|nr:hypothetical protein FACS1894202_00990 [Clostridia bacterium]